MRNDCESCSGIILPLTGMILVNDVGSWCERCLPVVMELDVAAGYPTVRTRPVSNDNTSARAITTVCAVVSMRE